MKASQLPRLTQRIIKKLKVELQRSIKKVIEICFLNFYLSCFTEFFSQAINFILMKYYGNEINIIDFESTNNKYLKQLILVTKLKTAK